MYFRPIIKKSQSDPYRVLTFERLSPSDYLLRLEHLEQVGRGQPIEVDLNKLLPHLEIKSAVEFYLAGDYAKTDFDRKTFKILPQQQSRRPPLTSTTVQLFPTQILTLKISVNWK